MHNLALVSAAYPPYSFGGIDVQTYHLAHALSSVGINVSIFCGLAKKPTIAIENENLTIYRLPLFDIPPRVVWFQLKNVSLFKKYFKNFDLIHTQHSSGSIYGFFKEKNEIPWVVSFHDHELRRLMLLFNIKPWNFTIGDIIYYSAGYPLFSLLSSMELKYADHYIVCGLSGYLDYERFSNIRKSKTTLIPNGVNIDKIKSAAESYREKIHVYEDEKDFTIFTCGRLYASKGVQYLINAMPGVIQRIPDVHLKIFGKGPLRKRFEKQIRDLNLMNHVTLEGHVTYERLMYELSMSDIAVFPTLIEVGASFAIMEAMAFKKPVVAFRYPFTMEVIEHLKTGYLVQPKKTNELVKAISLLLNDRTLQIRLGKNAYSKIMRDHNWSDTVKKYIDVYSQVVSMKN